MAHPEARPRAVRIREQDRALNLRQPRHAQPPKPRHQLHQAMTYGMRPQAWASTPPPRPLHARPGELRELGSIRNPKPHTTGCVRSATRVSCG
jgi:hypothetical protein